MTPIRRARDLGAPRPRRLTEQSVGGARHRIEGGPTTPAGIPIIASESEREPEYDNVVPIDAAYPTDRLPVVGGKFDPGARHSLPDAADEPEPFAAEHDRPFAIEDNGPDTDEFPIVTPDLWDDTSHPVTPRPAAHRAPDTFPPHLTLDLDFDTPNPAYGTVPPARPADRYSTDTFAAVPTIDGRPTDTFPPVADPYRADARTAAPTIDSRTTDTYPPVADPYGADAAPTVGRPTDTFPPRPAADPYGADSFSAARRPADTYPPRSSADQREAETFPPRATPAEDEARTYPPRPTADAADESSRTAPDYGRDDEAFARMIDRSPRRRVPLWIAPLAASVAGAVLIGGTYLQLRGPAPESTAASTPLSAPAVNPLASQCPTVESGNTVRGNGSGGTDSGVAAILAFQHAYYVARSGDQARTLLAPDAVAPPADAIQAGIDATPVGTGHCVEITSITVPGQYRVTVTVYPPDAVPYSYSAQLVETAAVGTKTLITAIAPAR
ncbi:hypothetical protein [Nocardia lasii]|uniref:DUF8176 domain-containing protein n=1 Tax=Nocardia lasii TaxID=1616107 RepID=A0ABW1JSK6_9NOCA